MPSKDEALANGQPKPEKPAKLEKEAAEETGGKPKTGSGKAEIKETASKVGASENAKMEGEKPDRGFTPPKLVRPTMGDIKDARGVLIKAALVAVSVLVVVIVVFGVLIYGYKSENQVVKMAAKVIPYPAQRVNGSFVTYGNYLFEVEANERAYQNNAKLNNQPAVDFNSADGKKLVKQIKQHSLDKLKNDAVVAQLAAQKHVKVTDKEVNDLISQLYDRYGGKDTLLKTLKQIYGWDLSDLKSVVRKQLLMKNLEDKVTSDPAADATAKAKAQDVLKKVKDNGDFTALAKQYSQASDASSGGDLGFFTKGQLPDNVQAAAEALQPGQVSDVIKTAYGYEILKVTEKKDDGSIHGMHILIKTIDFNEYFQNELKKTKTKTYISI